MPNKMDEPDKTEEEIFAEFLNFTIPIIEKLKDGHEDESWRGSMQCPKCGGTLRVSIAGVNGHTRGYCKTTGCLNWIE